MMLTKRELHKRITDAEAEISAALFFSLPEGHSPAWHRKQLLRVLVGLADGLRRGFPEEMRCERCGKAIRNGQRYITDGETYDHARCAGLSKRAPAHRRETAKEIHAELAVEVEKARAWLAKRPGVA